MKTFNCIFPGLYNYILTKDVGMIPYTLSTKYDTTITTYDNEEFSYMDELLKKDNFNIELLPKTGNEKNDVINYLKSKAKDIDILQLYHLRYNILPYYIYHYKKHNKNGKIYLKLDANNEFIDFLLKRKGLMPSLRRLYTKIIFKYIDLVSIETKRNYKTILESKILPQDKLLYLPNGIQKTNADITQKEKIILYVGTIEKRNKSTDMLIKAVNSINLEDWKLVLVGNVAEDMKEFLEKYDADEKLKSKIEFKGYISNKDELAREYAKSSIYCCTSYKESFGISTLEAAYHGNYIISTNVGGSPDIISQTGYGKIIDHNIKELEEKLEYTINNWQEIQENPITIQEKVYEKFNWNILCEKIIRKIEK